MSLKFFHIFFIVLSILLALGFAYWAISAYFADDHGIFMLIGGIISVIAGVGLVMYGKYFLKKLKKVSYL